MALVEQWDASALSYTPPARTARAFAPIALAGHHGAWRAGLGGTRSARARPAFGGAVWAVSATLISADACGRTASAWCSRKSRATAHFRRSGRHAGRDRGLAPRTVIPATGRCLPMAAPLALAAGANAGGFVRSPNANPRCMPPGAAQVLHNVAGAAGAPPSRATAVGRSPGHFGLLHQAHFADQPKAQWLHSLVADPGTLRRRRAPGRGAAQRLNGCPTRCGKHSKARAKAG